MTRDDPKIKVLICDDVAQLRFLYRRWLEREPDMDPVGEAVDGVAAVELTAKLSPDIVLLDINMPIKDGLDALREIRSSDPHVKVIMLSGLHDERLALMAEDLGAVDYIVKGTDLVEVGARIRKAHRR